ncbi:MAG TPA: hypothetical protein VF824_16075 [Thermoanaerobaculia bacterium]|jgi:hypothetical protein
MRENELLPGVTPDACPPAVVCDAHREIRGARRRALLRDVLQIVLLAAVDYLFFRWPEARMPFLGRTASLEALIGMNVVIAAHIWLARAMPRWTARRIAATWCRSERQKFLG